MLRSLYGTLRDTFPIERVVAFIGPLVLVPAAGFISAWVAQHFPGIPAVDSGWLAGIFITGAVSALLALRKWLDGRLKWSVAETFGVVPGGAAVAVSDDPSDVGADGFVQDRGLPG